jgi:exopolysaccharide production protein ExoZ
MKQKLEWLEFGRGIAALSVVLCHIPANLVKVPESVSFIAGWGDWGVSFFFVLSGFIIFSVHHDDLGHPERAFNFAKRRFFRIFPTYWMVLILFLTLRTLPLGNPDFAPDLSPSSLVRNFLLLPGYEPAIPPAWSLRNELLFYLVFLVAILNLRFGAVLFTAWMAVVLGTFAVYGEPPHFDNSARGIFTHDLNLFFAAGILIAAGRVNHLTTCSIAVATVFSVLTIALGQSTFIQLGIAALIVALFVWLPERYVHAPPFSRWMGEISYALYISHIPVMLITRGLMKRLAIEPSHWLLWSTVGILLCLVTAHLISRIEKPILALGRPSGLSKRF